MFTLGFALTAAFALPAAPALAQARFDFDTTPGRLSKEVVPTRYQLHFDLDPARDKFTGRARIALRLRTPVDSIVLHAKGLQASQVVLTEGPRRRVLRAVPDATTSTWRLLPRDGKPIAAGMATLEIRYAGQVQRSDEGLYRADYKVNGKPARWLATQLEAAYARMLFPGFDEPAFRAVFEIEVRAPREFRVLSNMPLAASKPQGARTLHRFAPTLAMPTYLVAVAVGHFDELAGEVDGVPLRIFTAEGKREQARYAMEVTRQVLPFYREYFEQPYALPKLDQLAVPSVRAGAMEDWGLISYNEAALLFEPTKSSDATRRRVFALAAHEIAHQWFGNLVTAASWEEIWLNEAFATWMEQKASEHFNPAWQVGLNLRAGLDRTLARDAGSATRAIRSGAVDEDRVVDVFDSITYDKGGAVLTMLEQWLGPEPFRRGLAAYMRDRRLSNATAGDLWFHIGAASGQDVAGVAATWTDQSGFPLVQVRAVECRGGRTVVQLAQQRFALMGELPAQRWKIPVRLARGGQTQTLVLADAEQAVELEGCDGAPVVVNAGGRGFYRVEYSAQARRQLAQHFTRLAPADRVSLLSDSFALALAGRAPMADHFALLALLPQVNDSSRAALLDMATKQFRTLDESLAGTPAQAALRSAGRALFGPELARLDWIAQPGESAEAPALRATLIERLADFDDPAVVQRARSLFDLDQSGASALPAAIRAAVIGAVGQHADAALFEQLLSRLKTASGEEDRWICASALAAGRDPGRAERLMALSLDGSLPPNVAANLPGMIGDKPLLAEAAYRFSLEHWPALARLAGSGPFGGSIWLLPSAAESMAEVANAERLLADQQRMLGDKGSAAAARIAAVIRLRASLRQREASAMSGWLANWQPAR